jgi:hypothetical protein
VIVILLVVAAVVGGGVRVGWDQLSQDPEPSGTVLPEPGEPLGFGFVEPPAMTVVDLRLTYDGSITSYQVNLVTRDYFVVVETPDMSPIEIARRANSGYFARPVGQQGWTGFQPDGDLDGEIAALVTSFSGVVTVSDALPPEVLPFATVILDENAQLPGSAPSGDEVETWRHYRIQVDLDAFRRADVGAFARWFGRAPVDDAGLIDMWVDADGIIRRWDTTTDGIPSVVELVDWSLDDSRFREAFVMQGVIDGMLATEGG